MEPLYIVAVQLNTLMAEGTATRKLRKENTVLAYKDCPAYEQMMAPHQETHHRDGHAGERHEFVSEDCFA